ncbi:MAG: NAD-dependent epimerase/dehydratase family protein [Bacteroidota bacterium]
MKALVTGGGGFIGSALAKALVKKGYRVTSFSRGDYPVLRESGIRTLRGDLSDLNLVVEAARNTDIIFHVAAKAGITGSYSDYYRTNVTGTDNVIKACKMNKIKYLIYTSSASVVFSGKNIEGGDESLPYPARPLSFYTATKAIAEKLVLEADSPSLRTLSLRPHLVYGPGDNHLFPRIRKKAESGRLQQIGDGRNKIDVSYIDNVISAHLDAAEALAGNPEASGKAYFITNGEPVLLWDFLNDMLRMSGLKPVSKSIPVWAASAFAVLDEVIHRTIFRKQEPFLTRFLVKELSGSHWFDITRARRLLNYYPSISNIEGLKRMTGVTNTVH